MHKSFLEPALGGTIDKETAQIFELSPNVQNERKTWSGWVKGLYAPAEEGVTGLREHWEKQMASGQINPSTWYESLQKKAIEGNNALAGLMSTRRGKAVFGVGLALMGMIYPSVLAKQFLPETFATNLVSANVGNYLFAKVPYPTNLILDNVQWIASGFIGAASALVQEYGQHSNITMGQGNNLTTRDLGIRGIRDPNPVQEAQLRDYWDGHPSGPTISEIGDSIAAELNRRYPQDSAQVGSLAKSAAIDTERNRPDSQDTAQRWAQAWASKASAAIDAQLNLLALQNKGIPSDDPE